VIDRAIEMHGLRLSIIPFRFGLYLLPLLFFSRIRKKIAYHFIKEDGVIITRCLAAGAEHQKRLHESWTIRCL